MPSKNRIRMVKKKPESVPGKHTSASIKHKKSLSKLQETDPEFYKFLKNEDTSLLDFDDEGESGGSGEDSMEEAEVTSDEQGSESEEDVEGQSDEDKLESDDEEESGDEKAVSDDEEAESDDGEVESDDGEVESDDEEAESDEEEDKAVDQSKPQVSDSKTKVTSSMVDKWTAAMKENPSPRILHELVMAFRAAVKQVAADEASTSATKYKVQGTDVFNAVVRGCIATLHPGLQKMLAIDAASGDKPVLPSTSSRWSKVRTDIKTYLTELIQLMKLLSASTVLDAVLKHALVMVPCFACFPKLSRVLVKRAVGIWSAGENSSRVVAFLVINKLVVMQQDLLLQSALKQMYMAYVSNCKFTSPATLATILFLQRSLVEMFSIDVHVTYQYAFVYIRQLAIHLRNAVTVKKEENLRAVYNWQYVHSTGLWTELLCSLHDSTVMQPLIYPLTQVIIGTVRLQPISRYLPLRFHCTKMLTRLSQSTRTYIPVLPLLLEVVEMVNFNKKHKAVSFKPYNFACLLKFSKSQMQGRAFKDGVIEHLVENLWDHLFIQAHSIGFPELVLPAQIQLKKFLKTCKIQSYTKQVKAVLTKVDETCAAILARRRGASLSLSDHIAIESWEKKSKATGTPLSKFYIGWRKQRDVKLQQIMSASASDKDETYEDDLESDCESRKGKKKKRKRGEESDDDDDDDEDYTAEELAVLSRPSKDDDDDNDEEEEGRPLKKTPKQKKKAKLAPAREAVVEDGGDIVKDFSFSSDED